MLNRKEGKIKKVKAKRSPTKDLNLKKKFSEELRAEVGGIGAGYSGHVHLSNRLSLRILTPRASSSGSFSRHSAHSLSKSHKHTQSHSTLSLLGRAQADADLIKEAALEVTTIPWTQLFRYATCFDHFLHALAVFFLIAGAILLTLVIYTYALFFRYATYKVNGCSPNVDQFKYYHLIIRSMGCGVCCFVYKLLFLYSSSRQALKIRIAYTDAILRKDYTWFDSYMDRNLPLRMTNDVTEIRVSVGEYIPTLVFYVLCCFLFVLLSFYIHFQLAILTLIFVPAVWLVNILKSRLERALISKEKIALEQAQKEARKILANIRAIRLFGGTEKALKEYQQLLFASRRLWKTVLLAALISGLQWFVPITAWMAVILITLHYIDHSPLKFTCLQQGPIVPYPTPFDFAHLPSISPLILMMTYATIANFNISSSIEAMKKIKRAQKIAAEVFFIIDWKSKIDTLSDAGEIRGTKAIGKLEMMGVNFAYPCPRKDSEILLKNLNITIYPGQMVTIFGPDACGKSTVLKLFLRLYDASSGKVRLDSFNVKSLNVGWLRSQFGVISQDLVLFNATIEENFRYAKLSATFDQITSACKEANVHDDIMALPHNYKTLVGPRSKNKLNDQLLKKILLARVFLQKPSIFLLDDFISDLVPDFEEFILTVLEKLREKCTIVMTTDKCNSIVKTCDNIFVMKDGVVVESGNHEDLMKAGHSYFTMVDTTMSDIITLKPIFPSQLTSYEFACSIGRMHENHDKVNKFDYRKSIKDPALLDSVYFRHVADTVDRLVQTRHIGGFTYENRIIFESNLFYCKEVVVSPSLFERDFRFKMAAPHRATPAEGEEEKDGRDSISPSSSTVINELANMKPRGGESEAAERVKEVASILKKPKGKKRMSIFWRKQQGQGVAIHNAETDGAGTSSPGTKVEGSEESNGLGLNSGTSSFESGDVVNSSTEKRKEQLLGIKKHQPRLRFKSSADRGPPRFSKRELLNPTLGSNSVGEQGISLQIAKFRQYFESHGESELRGDDSGDVEGLITERSAELESVKVIDGKLRQYFGFTVHSSMDNQSITSSDSYAFWDEYNLKLQLAIRGMKKRKLHKCSVFLLLRFSWPYLIFASFTSIILGTCLLYRVYVTTNIIVFYMTLNADLVTWWCFQRTALLAPFVFGVAFLQEIVLGFGTYRMNNAMRLFVFESFLKQKIEWYDFPRNDIGNICESLFSDVAAYHSAVLTFVTVVCEGAVILGGVCYYLYRVEQIDFPNQVFLIWPCIPFFLLHFFLEGRILARTTIFVSNFFKESSHVAFEIVTNVRSILMFGLHQHFLDLYKEALINKYSSWLKLVIGFRSYSYGVSRCSVFLIFGIWVAILLHNFQQPSLPGIFDSGPSHILELLVVGELLTYGICPLGYALAKIPTPADIRSFSSSLTEAYEVLKWRRAWDEGKRVELEPGEPSPTIQLRNVIFAYPVSPYLKVLDGVTLEIPSGKYVAIVGSAHSGKSTLLNIILNIYKPTEGTVLLGGKSYKEFHEESIHKMVGLIEHDPILFPDLSISENIAYGDNSRLVPMKEIKEAAETACLDALIDRMQHKFDTRLGDLPENPDTFVFRQRLAIARVSVQNPRILLVDGATSLIPLSTRLFWKALKRLRKGRTLIVASQRIETIRKADLIVVLANGRVVEMGTDAELMALQNVYHELYTAQDFFETNDSVFGYTASHHSHPVTVKPVKP